jgi:hypothetical protein
MIRLETAGVKTGMMPLKLITVQKFGLVDVHKYCKQAAPVLIATSSVHRKYGPTKILNSDEGRASRVSH